MHGTFLKESIAISLERKPAVEPAGLCETSFGEVDFIPTSRGRGKIGQNKPRVYSQNKVTNF